MTDKTVAGQRRVGEVTVEDSPPDEAVGGARILVSVVVGHQSQAGLVVGQRRRAADRASTPEMLVYGRADGDAGFSHAPPTASDSAAPSGSLVRWTWAEVRLASVDIE